MESVVCRVIKLLQSPVIRPIIAVILLVSKPDVASPYYEECNKAPGSIPFLENHFQVPIPDNEWVVVEESKEGQELMELRVES